ncbi:thiolase family protein [Sanguibacter suaedae]|uniref:Thiolase family protein n=1 Tax=Sanguibacter suaedae TaxID=2795737 RepID=A0A934M9Z0_9MICO|nr:thiolase family protein [Sanguibacter suaedae]MBI9115075.1 thiolase family protein [Sanguibacter suaedae]
MTDDYRTPVVVAARRTFVGTAGKGHRGLLVDELAAPVLVAALDDARRAGTTAPVDDVVLGNCTGPGGNVARVAALRAGLGDRVPGMVVDRQCGSGLAAILTASHAVRSGAVDLVLAGGAESASTAPERWHRPGQAPGRANADAQPFARAPFAPEGSPDPEMGAAADVLAAARGISRDRQDAYALASHRKALAAHAAGRFDRETVTLGTVVRDERARVLDPALLARLRPAFGGTVTAATASPVSDGAAAVAVVPESSRHGAPGLRVLDGVVVGCDPALPGWGPVPAVQHLLARTGRSLDEVAVVEIVEAFAAQVLAVTDALGLDTAGRDSGRVCPDGGALALGHPWGASGAIAVTRLFSRLVRGGAPAGTLGLATAAIGGGSGIAVLLEVVR